MGRGKPIPFLLKPCHSGLSWFHPLDLLYFKLGCRRRGLHRHRALTSLGSDIPAAHEWAGLRSWPCLSPWPGSREAQAGELREILGPQPLCWGGFWAAVGCFLWPRKLKGTLLFQSLYRPDSLHHGQLVENRWSCTSGHHCIHVSFPGNQSSFDPLLNVLAGSCRV